MGKRLNDTRAISETPIRLNSGVPVSSMDPEYSSRSVRKIDNGYIVCEHSGNSYSEKYSQDHPEVTSKLYMGGDNNPLKQAVSYINK